MYVALYNLEPRIVNTAMMQVSLSHKRQGDLVEIYYPCAHKLYDRVYAFSIFDYTSKHYVYDDMICGGTGFDPKIKLPRGIETEDYDWSLYSNCFYSVLWFSRGCPRNCPFCVVREKEGDIYAVAPKSHNPNGTYIKVMDNSFFANPMWKYAIGVLENYNQPVDFQGVDVRDMNEEKYMALNKFKHKKQIKIAWDNPKENLIPKIKEMLKFIKAYKIMCYVLIGYWSNEAEDLYRVESLRDLGVDPFVMPYNKKSSYQKNFARWVNHKAIFKTVKWKDYKKTFNQFN